MYSFLQENINANLTFAFVVGVILNLSEVKTLSRGLSLSFTHKPYLISKRNGNFVCMFNLPRGSKLVMKEKFDD